MSIVLVVNVKAEDKFVGQEQLINWLAFYNSRNMNVKVFFLTPTLWKLDLSVYENAKLYICANIMPYHLTKNSKVTRMDMMLLAKEIKMAKGSHVIHGR